MPTRTILLALLADQIGCAPDDFTGYAMRPTTLREHRAEIEALLGLRAFARAGAMPSARSTRRWAGISSNAVSASPRI